MSEFKWTKNTERAAQLVADGELRDDAIAAEVGVVRQTITAWKQHPDFAARVESLVEAFRLATRRRSIAMMERRVDALQDRWLRMRKVIEERAASPQMADVPGGTTGLLVHNVKGVGSGDDFTLVDLYEVDTALLKELREHEKQAAQELGQWADKQEISGRNGGPIQSESRLITQIDVIRPAPPTAHAE